MAQGDIPVTIPPVKTDGGEETFTITCISPDGTGQLVVRTGGKKLRINVQSGNNSFSVPIDIKKWHLTIEEDKEEV